MAEVSDKRRFCEWSGCKERADQIWKTNKPNGDVENRAYCEPHMDIIVKDEWKGCKREQCSSIVVGLSGHSDS